MRIVTQIGNAKLVLDVLPTDPTIVRHVLAMKNNHGDVADELIAIFKRLKELKEPSVVIGYTA